MPVSVQESLDNIQKEIQQKDDHWKRIINRQSQASTLAITNQAAMAVQSIALADADFNRWQIYQATEKNS